MRISGNLCWGNVKKKMTESFKSRMTAKEDITKINHEIMKEE